MDNTGMDNSGNTGANARFEISRPFFPELEYIKITY